MPDNVQIEIDEASAASQQAAGLPVERSTSRSHQISPNES